MKIVVTKNLDFYPDQRARLDKLGDVVYYDAESASPDEWYERCKGADIICTGTFGLNSDAVYKLGNVFISVPFVGCDFVDLSRLKEQEVTVANAPGCNKEAVAEWVIGALLLLFRQLDVFVNPEHLTNDVALRQGLSIWGKRISILGAGNIGQHLKAILTAFGAYVSFFRRGDDLLESVGDSDIVINCLAANEATRGLLNREFFQSLKKGVFFVSVARPQIYDVDALIDGLDNGNIAGAIDDIANANVGDIEDVLYKKLSCHPKCLVTPHISWKAESSARKGNDIMIDNIEAWLNKTPQNILNA